MRVGIRSAAPATESRPERQPAEARRRELSARRELVLALARAEESYAQAVRILDDFDGYLSGVRRRLQQAGYLAPNGRRPQGAALGSAHEWSANGSCRRHGVRWTRREPLRVAPAVASEDGR